jgi:hypothetical protein
MIADFLIYSGITVPSNYSWDKGEPLDGSIVTSDTAYSAQTYISGYAPGLKVTFLNASIEEAKFNLIDYNWNFGDFYNDDNNIVALSCLSFTEHTYIMPGKYTVTLTMTQAQREEDKQPETINPNDSICRGKGGIRWFWDELSATKCITWDGAACEYFGGLSLQPVTSGYDKWWDDELKCFQKYCKLWSWAALKQGYIFSSPRVNPTKPVTDNPVTWKETKYNQAFEKKWMNEANGKACVVDIIDIPIVLKQTKTLEYAVEVFELPPTAGISCFTQSVTGYSPLTVRFSPSACVPGSFPIDRIDWSFGDNSPIRTVSRYTPLTTDSEIIKTNTFANDSQDVRNFDVLHTYTVNKDTYPVFYPSLTCYSSNTNTSDSCSTIVGPVLLQPTSQDIQLIKSKNTLKGTIYTFNIDKNLAFTTTTIVTSNKQSVTVNIPTAPNKNTIYNALQSYGYTGDAYPKYVTPSCLLTADQYNRIITEDSNISRPPTAPEDGPNIPVNTENSFDIIP